MKSSIMLIFNPHRTYFWNAEDSFSMFTTFSAVWRSDFLCGKRKNWTTVFPQVHRKPFPQNNYYMVPQNPSVTQTSRLPKIAKFIRLPLFQFARLTRLQSTAPKYSNKVQYDLQSNAPKVLQVHYRNSWVSAYLEAGVVANAFIIDGINWAPFINVDQPSTWPDTLWGIWLMRPFT